MKLEVGKKYVSREGNPVQIVSRINWNGHYPMLGGDRLAYTEDGFFLYECIHEYDLISECTEPTRDSASDGWVKEARLTEAEARIKELEAELDALKPKPVTVSVWSNKYKNFLGKPHTCRASADDWAVVCRTEVIRIDTTTHPDGTVTVSYHQEQI